MFRIPHWYIPPLMLAFAGVEGLKSGVELLLAPRTTGSLIDDMTLLASVVLIWTAAIRWSMCTICLQPEQVIIRKLFKNIKYDYGDIDRFEFVTGKMFNYCYVGVVKNSSVIARTSYGPILIYNIIPKGKRLTRWLENLNSAFEARSATRIGS